MIWDIIAFALMIAMGFALWRYSKNDGILDWAIKYVFIAACLFGPYFFWDEIGAYWSSSEEGPVDLQQSWF